MPKTSAEGIEGEETEEWGVRKENEEKRTGGGGGTVEPEQSQARAVGEGLGEGISGREGGLCAGARSTSDFPSPGGSGRNRSPERLVS